MRSSRFVKALIILVFSTYIIHIYWRGLDDPGQVRWSDSEEFKVEVVIITLEQFRVKYGLCMNKNTFLDA